MEYIKYKLKESKGKVWIISRTWSYITPKSEEGEEVTRQREEAKNIIV